MLKDLLYSEKPGEGFMNDLKFGHVDFDKYNSLKPKLEEFVSNIKESNIDKEDICDLFNMVYELGMRQCQYTENENIEQVADEVMQLLDELNK